MEQSKSKVFTGPLGFLVILLFFMPYITVSCSGTEVSASGFELATGNIAGADNASMGGQSTSSSDPILFVIPVAGAVAIAVAFMSLEPAKTIYIVAGLVGLGVQIFKVLDYQRQVSEAREQGVVVNINYEFAWWLTAGALLAIAVIGFILKAERETVPRYGTGD